MRFCHRKPNKQKAATIFKKLTRPLPQQQQKKKQKEDTKTTRNWKALSQIKRSWRLLISTVPIIKNTEKYFSYYKYYIIAQKYTALKPKSEL